MIERDHYPAGVPCWIDTEQADPESAAAFYGGLFSWDFVDRMPPGAPGSYLVAQLDGRDVAAIGSPQGDAAASNTWATYIAVDSADDAAKKVIAAGGTVRIDPFDVGEAGRMAVVADPADALFCLWEARSTPGARVVNMPGTWVSSDLHTADVPAALDFYGEVFGWEAVEADGFTFLRLPGYGEFLERLDPDLRSRHEREGAPDGFADAVAWLAPRTDEEQRSDTPASWRVSFSVDDADAAAERAAALGGTVLVAPFDAPPVRMAVLADPAGATFCVSRYDPPS
jgi:predicted enzyme related to lactoylglutathione lyase